MPIALSVETAWLYHAPAAHIGVAVGLSGIGIAGLIGEQTEEDGCHFCAGDVAVRLNVAVRVADNVRKVVIAVQTGRYIIRNGNGGLVAAAATAAGGFFRKGPYAVQRKVAVSCCSPVRTVPSSFFQPLKEKVPFTPSFEPDTLAGTSATV